MIQKNRNLILLSILAVLTITAIFQIFRNRPGRSTINDTRFTVTDTASITKITFEGKKIKNILTRADGTWMVNGTYKADPSMIQVLLAVLHEVRVKRTVPLNNREEVKAKLSENGIKFSAYSGEEEIMFFTSGGNGVSLSFFEDREGQPYIVQLPGYESYVSGIFEVRENDWRDREIFSTTWAGIRQISLFYPGDEAKSFVIEPDQELFRVKGVVNMDTTRVMEYISVFSYFYADQYIEKGQIKVYDSLINLKPSAILTVNAISFDSPCEIMFFPVLPGEAVVLGLIKNEQMALFQATRIGELLKEKSYFSTNQ